MDEKLIAAAVRSFWGLRAGGTQAGAHPRAFVDLIVTDLQTLGWKSVGHLPGTTVVAGHFRPAKAWDIVCWNREIPKLAIEFKSQVGSYGNNENNRYEEALGSGLDLRAKYGPHIALGFVFVICDEPGSRRRTRQRIPDADPLFLNSSHVDRRCIFASRLLDFKLEGRPLYDAAAVLMTTRDGRFSHPADPRLNLVRFAEALSHGKELS